MYEVLEFLKQRVPKSAHQQFRSFKQTLNHAIINEVIKDMPYLRGMSLKKPKTKVRFLTEEEIEQVYKADTPYTDVQNAFVFSCYTGLRFIDLFNLRFSDIRDGMMYITQQKTGEELAKYLHSVALRIIEKQRASQQARWSALRETEREIEEKKDKVFCITSYDNWRRNVKHILLYAGIKRRITGHNARSSFGTNLYRKTRNPLLVQKELGHTSLAYITKYVEVVAEERAEGIKMLADIKE